STCCALQVDCSISLLFKTTWCFAGLVEDGHELCPKCLSIGHLKEALTDRSVVSLWQEVDSLRAGVEQLKAPLGTQAPPSFRLTRKGGVLISRGQAPQYVGQLRFGKGLA
ncbi:hypothetical protein GOODEAATRI_026193, partial [Goodea atripinnis]